MRKFLPLFLFAAVASADSKTCPPNYSYSGFTAPSEWQYVSEWKCGTERLQSPIIIGPPFETKRAEPITVRYQTMPLTVTNSGHDFRVLPTLPNTISVGEIRSATLDNIHFHTPSEHTFADGGHTAGEIHFVHKYKDGATEKTVVIGVLLHLENDNAALEDIIRLLPISLCATTTSAVNFSPLLSGQITNYYRYTGSLTTPACDGGVTFLILRTLMPIGARQLDALRQFGSNRRPLQPRNNRPITFVQ